MTDVTQTNRPTSVRNHCVIAFFGDVLCSQLLFELSVGIRVFVIGLSQISFFFSLLKFCDVAFDFVTPPSPAWYQKGC